MSIGTFSAGRRTMLVVCAAFLLVVLPLVSWAAPPIIPPPPKPKPGATTPATAPAATTPAAATHAAAPASAPASAHADSAAKAAAAAVSASAAKLPPLPDSTRAALRSEIERELKAMADSLKLSQEQRAQARPIFLDQAYQLKQIREKYAAQEKSPAVMDAMKKDVQALREATDTRLGAVFTVNQMAHFKAKREAWLGQTKARLTGATNAAAGATQLTPTATHLPAPSAPVDTTKK